MIQSRNPPPMPTAPLPAVAQRIFDRQLLRQRRERAAAGIAGYDFLLARVADDIADRLAMTRRQFDLALDLGSGPGLIGRAIAALPSIGRVISADLSTAMLGEVGSEIGGLRIAADEEALPFAAESLDLVVSGLSLHFVNDLPGSLIQIRRCLKPDGLFVGVILGGRTLEELRLAFIEAETEIEGGASPRVAPFADVRACGGLLQRAGFALPVTDSETVSVTYASPIALMRELRGMGASNALADRRRSFLRRETLARACQIYQERFAADEAGRVVATFEFITLTGWAPDESQPKPLRPGSATTRLADALGTSEISAGERAAGPEQGDFRAVQS